MKTKIISKTGFKVSSLGLGCAVMSEFYGAANEQEAIATLKLAVESGITLFDTANNYGCGDNEKLLGKILSTPSIRNKVSIATKFGMVRDQSKPNVFSVNADPKEVHNYCNESLARLGTDYIDLYYLHRFDKKYPIEEIIYALSQLVKEGKVRYIGLSEVNTDIIKKVHAIHPVTAIQSEYSLWTRSVEDQVLPLCKELGIGFIPYSALGRGFFAGNVKSLNDLEANDFRKQLPRFQVENMQYNLLIIDKLKQIALDKKCTVAQLVLSWLMTKNDFVVPIFGTKRRKYLLENIQAVEVQLNGAEIAAIEAAAPVNSIHGNRYPDNIMQMYGFKQ
jgi:aryl-alcohol dehydrogenase-like predicted oxidoreductase